MARKLAGMLFEEAVDYALRDLGALGRNNGVRTSTLAKRLRWLGLPLKRDQIIEKLHANRNAVWARPYAYFVGGTNDEYDTFAWAIHGE